VVTEDDCTKAVIKIPINKPVIGDAVTSNMETVTALPINLKAVAISVMALKNKYNSTKTASNLTKGLVFNFVRILDIGLLINI
jgi:hypothetical protein